MGVCTTLLSMYKNKRLYFSDGFISTFHNSFRQLRLTVWAESYLMSDFESWQNATCSAGSVILGERTNLTLLLLHEGLRIRKVYEHLNQ